MVPNGIAITPVGVVHNEQKEVVPRVGSGEAWWHERALADRAARLAVSRIEIDPALDGILDGIEEFSHLLVLWWADKNRWEPEKGVRVRPMGRQDLPVTGVFATRSPVRPNLVLVTVVRLQKRRGNTLEVTGLDAIDGSPVVDIKPMVSSDLPEEGLKVPEWLRRLEGELAQLDDEVDA